MTLARFVSDDNINFKKQTRSKINILTFRDLLSGVGKDADEFISTHCFYCRNCQACSLNSMLQKELKRNHFYSKNKHIRWWKITFDEQSLPVLSRSR